MWEKAAVDWFSAVPVSKMAGWKAGSKMMKVLDVVQNIDMDEFGGTSPLKTTGTVQ